MINPSVMRFLAFLTLAAVCPGAFSQSPQSPEAFLGHEVGEDYTLVPWPIIVDYFHHLDQTSDRVHLRELGKTTEGRPMLLAEISSADTIADLGPHRANQRKIADPRLIHDEEEERRLIEQSKVPIVINCQLHSTETAGSQMSMELAYELATSHTPEIAEILDRVIVLLIPCANPDGQQMVTDWYNRTKGEAWEGVGPPWIYQKYAGHDNNRDWFMLNLEETRLTTRMLYHEWYPTIVWDVHQMGNLGARLFVPPFHDPKNENVHPIIDQTLLIIGGHMAGDLAREGKRGVVHGAIYDNWWAGGFRTTPYRHNMVGILTEAASVNLASPIFQRKSELKGDRRGMAQYALTTNFPDPWPGGWWRLRDIVEYELTIAKSLLTLSTRYHDMFQRNYIHFGREAIEKGRNEPPFAWIIPADQPDPGRTYEMLWRLRATAIEIHKATSDFEADGVTYPAGSYILYCAQPYRPHLMDMMERQVYPDRVMYPGGPAEPPYDMAGWTLPLQMGVKHVAVRSSFPCAAELVDEITKPPGVIHGPARATHFVVPAGRNDDFRLRYRLHADGVALSIYTGEETFELDGGASLRPGSLVLTDRPALVRHMEGLSLDAFAVMGLPEGAEKGLQTARAPRAALYQPWTASMDEGWTRLVLETHEIAYTTIHNAEIRAGNLHDRYDCIILPSISVKSIVNGASPDTTFPEFVGGIGKQGVVSLQDFVLSGGTLVCIDNASNLPIDYFNVPIRNIVSGLETADFYCPGSVLRLWMDTRHPLGYGMPEWYSGYFARSQAFALGHDEVDDEGGGSKEANDRGPETRFPSEVVSRFSDTVLLESGWIRGGDLIADQPAVVEVAYGKGRIDLLGFGVQRRGQPHGTFRILFNAIARSTLAPKTSETPRD